MKVGLFDLHAVSESPSINFRMPVPIFMKFGMYIMASEPWRTSQIPLISLCLRVYLSCSC
jgi:hypothetical protein